MLLFSATLHSPEVRSMAANICVNPVLVDLKGKDSVPETVDHLLVGGGRGVCVCVCVCVCVRCGVCVQGAGGP